jgi:hemerythrin
MLAHVATEEGIMDDALYPERGRHRLAHEVFLADLQLLGAELAAAGPTPRVLEGLRVRVPEWLRFHIAANDLPLGLFLARRPASRAAPSALRTGAPGRGGSN